MKIGFIGMGNMAQAILGGIIEKEVFPPEDLLAFDLDSEKLKDASLKFGFMLGDSNAELVKACDLIFLAVKPQYFAGVAKEICDLVTPEKAFISIMAGLSNDNIKAHLGEHARILRVMPNLPLTVGEGMTCLCAEHDLTLTEYALAVSTFSAVGRVEILSEKDISAFAAIAGSSPAYVFLFLEAMADAACMAGIPRSVAYPVCAQAVLGSAKLALSSQHHVAELKDMVCSPGGTTIEGVYALEQGGFRKTVMDSVLKAVEKFDRMQGSGK